MVKRTARALGGWLGPAYGGDFRLVPDLDRVEALSPEREALWARLEKTSFLTDDEKRAAIGYGAKGSGGGVSVKFNPHHDDRGRFTFRPDGSNDVVPAGRLPGGKPPLPTLKGPAAPVKPAPGPSTGPPKSTQDVLKPGGNEVGVRRPSAGEDVRTVTPSEFDRIRSELQNGAREVSAGGAYQGKW